MFPKTNSVLLALLLAYRALAAPANHEQHGQIQSVMNALKLQVEELDPPSSSEIIDDVESALKVNGVLDAKHIAALNQKIEVSKCHWCFNNLVIMGHVVSSSTAYRYITNRENPHRR